MASLDTRTPRRVLRHRRYRTYFKHGAWTRNLDQADDFSNVRQVAETCIRYRLRGVDLVLGAAAGLREISIQVA